MRGAEECEHEQRRMRNDRSWTPCVPPIVRWAGVSGRGHTWPAVAREGGSRCDRPILGRAEAGQDEGDCRHIECGGQS